MARQHGGVMTHMRHLQPDLSADRRLQESHPPCVAGSSRMWKYLMPAAIYRLAYLHLIELRVFETTHLGTPCSAWGRSPQAPC